jgi:hypothetical protein
MPTLTASAIVVYANGLWCCSVCAPLRYTAEMVEREVNEINPTGVSSEWRVSKDKQFSTGQPNPCPCNDPASGRQHWLMNC